MRFVNATPYGTSDLPVYTDVLMCKGDEVSLAYCDVESVVNSFCDAQHIVGIVCQGKYLS